MEHDQVETQEEIKDELEELGVDNEATGSPDLFISGQAVRVGAAVLVLLLLVGVITLVF